MAFYQDTPQRQRMLAFPKVDLALTAHSADPPLPIDDKGGGCDTPDHSTRPGRASTRPRIAPRT